MNTYIARGVNYTYSQNVFNTSTYQKMGNEYIHRHPVCILKQSRSFMTYSTHLSESFNWYSILVSRIFRIRPLFENSVCIREIIFLKMYFILVVSAFQSGKSIDEYKRYASLGNAPLFTTQIVKFNKTKTARGAQFFIGSASTKRNHDF